MVENYCPYTTHIVLFKSPRDVQQVALIVRQLNSTQFLKESYELATKQQFGHFRNFIRNHETSFRKILSKQASLKEKRKIFFREIEPLKTVTFLCYVYLNTA